MKSPSLKRVIAELSFKFKFRPKQLKQSHCLKLPYSNNFPLERIVFANQTDTFVAPIAEYSSLKISHYYNKMTLYLNIAMEFHFSFCSVLDEGDFIVVCFSRLQKLVGKLNQPEEHQVKSGVFCFCFLVVPVPNSKLYVALNLNWTL